MDSSSGTSSSLLQTSGSEENLQQVMDQRKRKRMLSNRESARRSRMRKQRHLDDLTAQVAQLRGENNRIITSISATTQQFLNVEGENSILRAQVAELSHRLQSLIEIIGVLTSGGNGDGDGNGNGNGNGSGNGNGYFGTEEPYSVAAEEYNPWNYMHFNQPIMASAEMLQY